MASGLDDAFGAFGGDDTAHMTNDEIRQRTKMIENEIRIMRSECARSSGGRRRRRRRRRRANARGMRVPPRGALTRAGALPSRARGAA